MARAKTTPPAKNRYLFISEAIIEATTEEEAREIFAFDSLDFAGNAECYEVCSKCYSYTRVKTCECGA